MKESKNKIRIKIPIIKKTNETPSKRKFNIEYDEEVKRFTDEF